MVFSKAKQHVIQLWTNQTVKWIPPGRELDFNKALKESPDDKDLLWYKENPISYRINNYGFRSPLDYSTGLEGNIFLGCSHTFGIGHHLENVWSWKVNEAVGGNFLNLSVPGSGISTASRLLHAFKTMLKPKNIFLHHPHPYRYEFFNPVSERWTTISHLSPLPWHDESVINLMENKYVKNIVVSPDAAKKQYISNYYWIKGIAQELGANFYCVPFVEHNKIPKNNSTPERARDKHLPVSYHNYVASLFLDQVENGYKTNFPDYMFHMKWDVKRNII